jgi:hypothetical protein
MEDKMSVYSGSYNQNANPNGRPELPGGCGSSWKPIELIAMVLGFIVFWPIGLAILFAKIWQKKHGYGGDIPSFVEAKFREKWREDWQSKWQQKWEAKMARWGCHGGGDFMRHWEFHSPRSSGNAAFDEWRETELARLEEERQKLLAAEREFAAYMENLRRAKDREEFDRFMAARRSGSDNSPQPSA